MHLPPAWAAATAHRLLLLQQQRMQLRVRQYFLQLCLLVVRQSPEAAAAAAARPKSAKRRSTTHSKHCTARSSPSNSPSSTAAVAAHRGKIMSNSMIKSPFSPGFLLIGMPATAATAAPAAYEAESHCWRHSGRNAHPQSQQQEKRWQANGNSSNSAATIAVPAHHQQG